MFKHVVHLIFFVAGAGFGVWWGVNHPTQAASISKIESTKIDQAVMQGKQGFDAAKTKLNGG